MDVRQKYFVVKKPKTDMQIQTEKIKALRGIVAAYMSKRDKEKLCVKIMQVLVNILVFTTVRL